MDIKQLTYTNSRKTGWDIERCLGVPNEKEKNIFGRIASEGETGSVVYSFDAGADAFVLARSVPYGTDALNRARYYVHGYVFSGADWKELFTDYGALLAVDYFASNEKAALYEIKSLSGSFNGRVAGDALYTLTESVYEAILDRQYVEICTTEQDRELFIKCVMNTVYEYLPLSLRRFVSFASGVGKVRRTVTATGKFTGFSGIKYDFTTGEVSGLSGKYESFVRALLGGRRDFYLGELERRAGAGLAFGKVDTAAVESAIKVIMFDDELASPIDKENAIGKLADLLTMGRYRNPQDIEAICSALDVIRKKKLITAKALDKKLVETFKKTTSSVLKEKISAHIVDKYAYSCDKSSFDAINSYEAIDTELFRMITEQAILGGSREFLHLCASRAAEDSGYASFIKKSCHKSCAMKLAEELAAMIKKEALKGKMTEKIMRSDFYPDVTDAVVKSKDAELGWVYVSTAYNNAENFRIYRGLEKDKLTKCEKIFYREITNRINDGIKVLENIYTGLEYDVYLYVEKKLAKAASGAGLLEEFYVKVLSKKAHSAGIFESQKERMLQLGLPVGRYISEVISVYSGLCMEEGEKSGEDKELTMQRIAGFTEDNCTEGNPVVEQAKRNYWKNFSWKKFRFSENIRTMSIQGEEASTVANAVMNLYDYICGRKDSYDKEELSLLARMLCSKNELLKKRERDRLLKMLKKSTAAPYSYDMDVVLLINYSNRKRGVELKGAELGENAIEDYIIQYGGGDVCMLDMPGVFGSLYKYVRKMHSDKTKGKGSYGRAFLLMQGLKESRALKRRCFVGRIPLHTAVAAALCIIIAAITILGVAKALIVYPLAIFGMLAIAGGVYRNEISVREYICDLLIIVTYFVLLYIAGIS